MEQTNRTILFEEINPEVENLLTYIDSENSESLPDSILRKIQNSLEVSSFDEFLNKMQPKIYLYMNSDTKNVFCTTQPNGTEMTALSLYEEVQCIAFERGNRLLEYYLGKISGSAKVYEVVDDDLKIAEMIGPGYSKEDFYTAYSRFMSLLAENKVSEAKVEMRNFCHKYRNTLVMLPMIIDYMQEVLYRLGNGKKVNQIMVQKDEGTQVKIEKVSAAFLRRSIKLNEYTINTYAEIVQEQLQSITNTALIKDFFQIAILEYEKDDVALENMYEQYLMYYQKVMEQFWWDARPLLEKLLGVYTFFLPYQLEEGKMKPKLVVANMILQDMIQAKNKERLELYLNSANEKNSFENTIWYAIVPRMEYVGEERNENIRERFRGNDKKSSLEVNSVTELHVLMDMLAKHRVQTFVSPTNLQNTTAEWVLKNGIDEWVSHQQEWIQRSTAEYIYPSFPNFCLMKDMHMEIRMGGNDKGIRYNSFWLREVAIEASYVAAGMFVALQCPEYLAKTLKNKVWKEYPGVGFRILDQEHNIKFPSVLKSGTLMFPQSVLEDVERKCYGVFFAPYGNKVIIVQDRAMTGNYDVKDNVSIVQTLTYIERMMRYETQDFKSTLIEQFFQKRPNSLLSEWNKNNAYANSVIKQGEEIQYTLDKENRECILEIMFDQTKYQRKVRMNQ